MAASVFFFFFFVKLLLLSLEHRKLCRDYRRRGRDDDIGIIYSLVCSPAESVSPPCAYCDVETDRRCSRYNTFSVPTAMDWPEIRLLQLIWGVCVCACSDSSTALQYAHVRAWVRGISVWGADILAFFSCHEITLAFFSLISWFNYTNDSRGLNKISSFFRGQRKMKRWRLSRRVLWQNVKSSTNNFLLLNTRFLRISACTYRNFERVYDKHNIYEGCKRNGFCKNNVGKEKCKN